jgi:hypothetical protein
MRTRGLLRGARVRARCVHAYTRLAALVRAARGSLRSGRGGRRGRLAPCRGPLEGARAGGSLAAVGDVEAPPSAWPLIRPARTLAGRASPRSATRLPPLTLGAEIKGIRKGAAPLHRCAHGYNRGGSALLPTAWAPAGVACDVEQRTRRRGAGARGGRGRAASAARPPTQRRSRARGAWGRGARTAKRHYRDSSQLDPRADEGAICLRVLHPQEVRYCADFFLSFPRMRESGQCPCAPEEYGVRCILPIDRCIGTRR